MENFKSFFISFFLRVVKHKLLGIIVWFRIGLEPILSTLILDINQISSEMVVSEAPYATIL